MCTSKGKCKPVDNCCSRQIVVQGKKKLSAIYQKRTFVEYWDEIKNLKLTKGLAISWHPGMAYIRLWKISHNRPTCMSACAYWKLRCRHHKL